MSKSMSSAFTVNVNGTRAPSHCLWPELLPGEGTNAMSVCSALNSEQGSQPAWLSSAERLWESDSCPRLVASFFQTEAQGNEEELPDTFRTVGENLSRLGFFPLQLHATERHCEDLLAAFMLLCALHPGR